MKIIGHRGAAGSELENTLASLQKAIHLGVYAIEFDVRRTKDGHLVVCHDADLKRIANDSRKISDLSLKTLQKIPLHSSSDVPSLKEAMEVIGSKRAVIELKDSDCAEELLKVLSEFPSSNVTVASFKHSELAILRKLDANIKLYGLERTNPFDIIHVAKRLNLNGIGLNYWLLNPLTYWLAKRAGLEMYVYTVDRPFQARFLNILYPDVGLCTNYPERFNRRRRS